jgi:hypothetical protein
MDPAQRRRRTWKDQSPPHLFAGHRQQPPGTAEGARGDAPLCRPESILFFKPPHLRECTVAVIKCHLNLTSALGLACRSPIGNEQNAAGPKLYLSGELGGVIDRSHEDSPPEDPVRVGLTN